MSTETQEGTTTGQSQSTTESKKYVPYRNEEAGGQLEIIMDGRMAGVSNDVRKLKTSGNPYQIAKVHAIMPNGKEQECNALIWTKSLTKFPDSFAKGQKVALRVNIDPDSEYQGNAVIQLPNTVQIDVSLLNEFIDFSGVEGIDEVN